MSSTEPVLVMTTLPADTDPSGLAGTLVEERLAACVNVQPEMESTYRWKGAVERDRERQVLIKTTRDRLAALRARITELHPYELPEFIVVPIGGDRPDDPYMRWVIDSTRPA
ncbi:MAG: divalent-cation tolerance protein CutA [Vicinamibacterales bacterium]